MNMFILSDRKGSSSSYMGIPTLSLLHQWQTCSCLHRSWTTWMTSDNQSNTSSKNWKMAHVSPSLQIYNEILTRNQKCGRHIITIPCRKSRRAAHSWHNQWSCSSFHQIIRYHHWISKRWKDKGNKSSPFYKIKDELTTSKNTILKSNCIVIPQTLIQKTLEIPHN